MLINDTTSNRHPRCLHQKENRDNDPTGTDIKTAPQKTGTLTFIISVNLPLLMRMENLMRAFIIWWKQLPCLFLLACASLLPLGTGMHGFVFSNLYLWSIPKSYIQSTARFYLLRILRPLIVFCLGMLL